MPVAGGILCLPLADVIDVAAESARLGRETAKLAAERGKLEAKLGNPGFLAKADEEVVEDTRARAAELGDRMAKLEAALGQIARA